MWYSTQKKEDWDSLLTKYLGYISFNYYSIIYICHIFFWHFSELLYKALKMKVSYKNSYLSDF